MILINASENRERRLRILDTLGDMAAAVNPEVLKNLDAGFFTSSGQKCLIEIKKVPEDLIASLSDRIWRQRAVLAEHEGPKFFLFEGFPRLTKTGNFVNSHRESQYTWVDFIGLTLSLYYRGIGVLWAYRPEDTPAVLLECYKYFSKSKHNENRPPAQFSWGRPTRPERLVYFYQGLSGIGPEAAASLADVYQAPVDLFSASLDDLKSIPHIGNKRAKIIYEFARGKGGW